MALSWNTRQLLSSSSGGTPVEFHFLSRRQLYDSTILTHGPIEWAVVGDHHWYSVAVITRPVYAIPQELCLAFDCFSKRETVGRSVTNEGPPIDDVALEFGVLLSLLVREPLLPLGTRRINGKPVKLNSVSHVDQPLPSQPIVPKGIDSTELRTILCGLAGATEDDSNAILAAARLYHAALSLSAYDVSTAYFSLVAAIECLSGHHLREKTFAFDDVEKFKKAGAVIEEISTLITNENLIDNLKREVLDAEHFVWQKFRAFIEEFLPEEFWQQKEELHPDDGFASAIEKGSLRRFLREAYDARSAFAHRGVPFPAHVEIGISDRVPMRAALERFALVGLGSTRFVPPFIWFERLTHFVLREYLFRVIAPTLAQDLAIRAQEKARLLEAISSLCERARKSLERLTRWTARLTKFGGFSNPRAPNREWALDEVSIQALLSAGLIDADSQSMNGTSCIKNRAIGEIVGEFFFGADQNPLRDNTILDPE
jgi:hypothetical protein